ncbi:MAG: hypothetical protein EA350_09075 [Gemmatimonadales bacterium]|nr:MAG: hypothetical protein EA350_09075 [Gemmatimonadales bacterium]
MFDSLRQAFREAVDNFRTELNRDAVPEAADRLIRAMEQEMVDARVILDRLGDQIEETRREAAAEDEQLRACLRREEMARKIGDAETEKVAREYAARHLQRKDLLEEKLKVLERESADRRAEMDDMATHMKNARARREALLASSSRSGARDRLQEADDLFADLDRMAERLGDLDAQAAAAEAMNEPDPPPSGPPPMDVEERLRVLKEHMRSRGGSD